eukprot:COSAG02_NODE_2861_length_7881_cov_10.967618_1_plen_76_part_00
MPAPSRLACRDGPTRTHSLTAERALGVLTAQRAHRPAPPVPGPRSPGHRISVSKSTAVDSVATWVHVLRLSPHLY